LNPNYVFGNIVLCIRSWATIWVVLETELWNQIVGYYKGHF